MDGVDRAQRRLSLKERLGLKGFGCCGATWGSEPTTLSVREDGDDYGGGGPLNSQLEVVDAAEDPFDPPPPCAGMNLATALAAERQLRAALESDIAGSINGVRRNSRPAPVGTPRRVSLMRLLEETEGCDGDRKEEVGVCDWVCCVCMRRKKGAAFIPCGHCFCRVCSREVWLNRRSCPLCNRPIRQILDIY